MAQGSEQIVDETVDLVKNVSVTGVKMTMEVLQAVLLALLGIANKTVDGVGGLVEKATGTVKDVAKGENKPKAGVVSMKKLIKSEENVKVYAQEITKEEKKLVEKAAKKYGIFLAIEKTGDDKYEIAVAIKDETKLEYALKGIQREIDKMIQKDRCDEIINMAKMERDEKLSSIEKDISDIEARASKDISKIEKDHNAKINAQSGKTADEIEQIKSRYPEGAPMSDSDKSKIEKLNKNLAVFKMQEKMLAKKEIKAVKDNLETMKKAARDKQKEIKQTYKSAVKDAKETMSR